MESLKSEKFKTLEKEQMEKVVGGVDESTTQSIWTYRGDFGVSGWDDSVSDDSTKPILV